MKIGDKYYYTGDMANIPDFGIITNIVSDKWGERFTGKLNDGRIQKCVSILCFSKGAGQRFKPIEQYNEEREKQLNKMNEWINKNKTA